MIAGARAEGISDEWIEAAQRSPVYALIKTYRVALPLHPEYRTMPMVWYIPPLSPVVDAVSRDGHDGEDLGNLFGAIDALRIPMRVPGRAVHRRRHRAPSRRCCAGSRRCGPTCATSTSVARPSRTSRRRSG